MPEDAEINRLYVPQDLLHAHGMAGLTPEDVATHENLPAVCKALGRLAQERFDKAETAIAACNPKAMRAPIVMMKVYYQNLKRLRAYDWQPQSMRKRGKTAKVAHKIEKLFIGLRYGFF